MIEKICNIANLINIICFVSAIISFRFTNINGIYWYIPWSFMGMQCICIIVLMWIYACSPPEYPENFLKQNKE